MKRKTKGMRVIAAALMASMVAAAPAMAAGPVAERSERNYDEATWARLRDNVLEYDEIPLLIHEYNPTISDIRKNLEDAVNDLQRNVDELRSHQLKMEHLKDQAADDADVDSAVAYGTSEAILNQIASDMDSAKQRVLSNRSTMRSIESAENQLADAARQVMIMYDSTRRQLQTLNQLAEMYDAQYQLAVNRQAQGMATEAEVFEAMVNQLSARSSREALESGILSMKPILCYLTGWPADADPQIAEVPALDLAALGEIDLEDDIRKAIGNNQTLKGQRTSQKGKTSDGIKARLDMIEEGDEKLRIEMKRLYDDMFIKKTALEAAQLGLQAAEKDQAYYDRMYQQGMVSRSQYLAMQISCCQRRVAFQAADLNMRQAVNSYDAAVRGTAAVSD